MNRVVLFGLVLVALTCYFQAADAEIAKRYVYNVRRDVTHVSDMDQDYDSKVEKRFVYKRSATVEDADDKDVAKRFVVTKRDAEENAKNEDKEEHKDYARSVFSAREARAL